MKHLPFVLLLPLFAACVEPPELGEETSALNPGCPIWGCNENSPLMAVIGNFHELDFLGTENRQHMRILDFRLPNSSVSYQARIVGKSRLVVESAQTGIVSGHALEGGWFNIDSPYGVYKLFIQRVTPAAVSPVHFWVGTPTPIETYTLTYMTPTQTEDPYRTPLCNYAPPESETGTGQDSWASPLEAFVFTGDRYDDVTKTVAEIDDSSGFFNIACAGSALAKLHLNRHTTAGSPGPNGAVASKAKRQAMLKMYVSDVCGTGSAWTIKGTPLRFTDTTGWFPLATAGLTHEAYWDQDGAQCLDTHRLGSLYDYAIHHECRVPACPTGVLAPRMAMFSSWIP